MATESKGSGDPARILALLWRTPQSSAGRRGPRPSLDVDRIVAAAVQLADAEGLAALSMRRVALELGVAVMTLYSHVPTKGDLVDLMVDSVLGELYPEEQSVASGNWRARLDAVARANRAFFLRHPWALQASTAEPPAGPNRMRKFELELRAVDGLDLSEVQMDLLITLVNGFVRGMVGSVRQQVPAEQLDLFPTAARVTPLATAELRGTDAAERSFEFGLERLLDGIGVLILNASR
jgi:AcrR family transcriptional regulator